MKRKSVFRNVRLHVQRVLESPSEELGQAARFLAYQIRLWRLCGRTLVRDRLPTVAGDLTFKTILGIVPAFVLFLLFVNLFSQESDIGQRLQQQVYKALNISEITMRVDEEDVSLADKIDDLVSAVSRNVTAAAAVGFVFLIVLALSVLAGAEQAMNQIWRTGRGRRLWRRLGMFWVVLTLGPVAVALAAYMSSWMEEWLAGRTAPVSVVGQGIIGFLAAWFVLSLVYKILPNTPVTSRAALIGAMVASVIWMLVAKQAFGLYVRYAVGYRQIFGSLAVVPVFFIWIYISWIIVLFGCELAYVVQNLRSLARAEQEECERNRFLAADFVCLKVSLAAAERFVSGEPPVTLDELRETVGVSPVDLRSILEALLKQHLLAEAPVRRGSIDDVGYLPARSPDKIQVKEVAAAAEMLQPEPFTDSPSRAQASADDLYRQCTLAREGVVGDRTLADLLSSDG